MAWQWVEWAWAGGVSECPSPVLSWWMAGIRVGIAQRDPRVCHAGATQVVQLGLEWAKGPGFAGLALAGLQMCLDPAPICTIKVEGKHKKWCLGSSDLERTQSVPCPFSEFSIVSRDFLHL